MGAAEAKEEPELRRVVEAMRAAADDIGKEPCDLSCEEFRSYIGRRREGIPRALVARLGGFARIRGVHFPPLATQEARLKRKMQVISLANNRVGRREIDDAEVLATVEQWAARVFERTKPITKPRKIREADRHLDIETENLLLVGDEHVGGDLKAEHTRSLDYGPQEEARRYAELICQINDFSSDRRARAGLTIVHLGDLVEGEIHGNWDQAIGSEQFARSLWLKCHLAEHTARAYRRVRHVCLSGNHDEPPHTHKVPERCWDTVALRIYTALKLHMRSFEHVTFEIPLAADAVFRVLGHKFYATHGHSDLRLGSPGRSINVASIQQQVDALCASEQDGPFAVVLGGHVHQAIDIPLNNGTELIVNGAFTPINVYAKRIGYRRSSSSQFVAEVTPSHPIGKHWWIDLDERTDAKTSHDRVVPTWKAF